MPADHLDEKGAIVEMQKRIDAREAELSVERPERPGTFDEAAREWLHDLEHVQGAESARSSSARWTRRH